MKIDIDSIISDIKKRRRERKKEMAELQKEIFKKLRAKEIAGPKWEVTFNGINMSNIIIPIKNFEIKGGKMKRNSLAVRITAETVSIPSSWVGFDEYKLTGSGDIKKAKQIGCVLLGKKSGVQNVQSVYTGNMYRVEQDAKKITKIIRLTSTTDFVLYNIA